MLSRPALLLAAAPLVLAASAGASPVGDDPRLEALLTRARERGLADSRAWQVLLHYQPDRLGPGVTSLADSPSFFRAPDGKTDPRAELEATLAGFVAAGANAEAAGAPCALPARYRWLDQELDFEAAGLSRPACPELHAWLQALDAAAVTLVFAEAYLNNPASMFGHTLLRIDAAPHEAREERRDLLAYAVNFAAEPGADPGPLFAMKGIVGAYPGYFSLEPYYEKVRRYGDWESRDLWEYPLALSREEVRRLLLHLWELRETGFDYYFFDENCSFELLGLLEAARPDLDLRGRFGGWVIPIDTVRETVARVGLAGPPRWRPSAATRLRHLGGKLPAAERRLARAVAEGAVAPEAASVAALPEDARALVLTLAHDHLRFRSGPGEEPASRTRALEILTARSRLAPVGEPGRPPQPPATSPDRGHGTARLALGSGFRDGRFYWEARLRPAFHDALDPQGGFTEGPHIDFIEAALRYYPRGDELDLHELKLLEILSLAPRDELFRPIAWKLSTGLQTRLVPRPRRTERLRSAKLWRSQGGAGLVRRIGGTALAYAFAEAAVDVSGRLRPGWAAGLGTSFGVLLGDAEDRWRAALRGHAMRFVAGDTHTALGVGLDQRLRLSNGTALELRLGLERDFQATWLETGLAWKLYF